MVWLKPKEDSLLLKYGTGCHLIWICQQDLFFSITTFKLFIELKIKSALLNKYVAHMVCKSYKSKPHGGVLILSNRNVYNCLMSHKITSVKTSRSLWDHYLVNSAKGSGSEDLYPFQLSLLQNAQLGLVRGRTAGRKGLHQLNRAKQKSESP